MNELTIQTHDFNAAKKQIKEFSEEISSSVDLQMVDTNEGLFNWFAHKVTGDELNSLAAQIQAHLIAMNNLHIASVKEFGEVYKALESLDKDYIQAIIISVKAAEKASAQAKEAAVKAEKNSLDITKAIEVQKQTINVLKNFKERLDKNERLESIDEIWNDCQVFKEDIRSINDEIRKIIKMKEQMTYMRSLQEKDKISDEERNKIIKKLKISYMLAGGSLGVALINFVCIYWGLL